MRAESRLSLHVTLLGRQPVPGHCRRGVLGNAEPSRRHPTEVELPLRVAGLSEPLEAGFCVGVSPAMQRGLGAVQLVVDVGLGEGGVRNGEQHEHERQTVHWGPLPGRFHEQDRILPEEGGAVKLNRPPCVASIAKLGTPHDVIFRGWSGDAGESGSPVLSKV